jgi:hypothetical protein
VRATLLVHGLHVHKGQWRRRQHGRDRQGRCTSANEASPATDKAHSETRLEETQGGR